MAKTIDKKRSAKAIKYVEQGMSPPQAMIKAGYSKGYATDTAQQYALSPLLKKTRYIFMSGFMKGLIGTGCTGEEAGKRLGGIALKGKDFDSIQAIKVAGQLMTTPNDNIGNITFSGVFVVPPIEKNWEESVKNMAINGKIVDVNTTEQQKITDSNQINKT